MKEGESLLEDNQMLVLLLLGHTDPSILCTELDCQVIHTKRGVGGKRENLLKVDHRILILQGVHEVGRSRRDFLTQVPCVPLQESLTVR